MIKKSIFLLFLICLVPLYSQVVPGDTARHFELPDTSGSIYSLTDFERQVVLLNFFATWCVPCQIEAPQLEDSIWQVFRDRGVSVVGIDFQEFLPPLQNFIDEFQLTYPILRDTAGVVFRDYGLTIFPTNVLVDRNGNVAWVEEGFNIPRLAYLIDSLTTISPISVGEMNRTSNSALFDLHANYPNPFNNQTRISFTLRQAEEVIIYITDIAGRQLHTIQNLLQPGNHKIDVSFAQSASGIYFYTVRAGNDVKTGKMIFQK